MTSIVVVGSTGLVGAHILSTLISLPSVSSVHALSRRQLPSTDSKLHSITSPDSDQWPTQLSAISPRPSIFFSGLGTTRGTAGSIEKQRKIDYDLNLALAQAAKSSGVKVYVLISSANASSSSRSAYLKMKGDLEDSVKALDFEHTVLLRPGIIVGSREESRPVEFIFRKIAESVGGLSNSFKDPWAQDAEVIAQAAVIAGIKALKGGDAPKVWEFNQAEIVRLRRAE